MDRIYYAGDTIFTGSDIARAVMDYANALARNSSSDTVRIPVYDEDGVIGESEFLLGPASQIAADSVEREWDELIDEALVEKIAAATRALGAARPTPVSDADPADFPEFEDI